MNMNQWIDAVPPLVLSVTVGIIGFFLRRTVGLVDKHEEDISNMKDLFVTKDEWNTLQNGLRAEAHKLSEGIESLKDNSIRKDDFVREIADLNRRQDRIYDILLELKGDAKIG